jgi:hypothetical protein
MSRPSSVAVGFPTSVRPFEMVKGPSHVPLTSSVLPVGAASILF